MESSLSSVRIPQGVSFPRFILNRAKLHGNKTAFIDGVTGKEYRYNEIEGIVKSLAGALYHNYGLRKGDVLCCCMNNSVEYVLVTYAAMILGGVLTTVNPLYTPDDIQKQLITARFKFVVTMPDIVEKVTKAASGTQSNVKEIFVVGKQEGFISFESLMTYNGRDAPEVAIDPKDDTALLPFSSGTTGKQKGVILTHYNMVANCLQSCHPDLDMGTQNDVFVWVLPFYHVYGISCVFSFIPNVGGTTVILPKFDLEMYLRIIQKYKVTVLFIVPPLALHLARSPLVDRYNMESLRLVICGAAPLGPELQTELTRRLQGVRVKQGYGMTETSPMLLCPPVHNWINGSSGIIVPNTRWKVREENTDAVLGPNKRGELCVQGPQIMKGYLDNPQATKEIIDADGWLHTGDICYYDENGNFFVVDRLKELIKFKGLQVAPAELESLILTHPRVADVAVIGQPDLEAGELPMAFIVTKQGTNPSAEEIISFVAGQVSPHKRLRGGVVFVDEIPKSGAGKILRRSLRDRLKSTRVPSKL